jgi:hypothetical protein
LHLIPKPPAADAVHGRQKVEQFLIRALEYGERLLARERFTGQNVVGQLLPKARRNGGTFIGVEAWYCHVLSPGAMDVS